MNSAKPKGKVLGHLLRAFVLAAFTVLISATAVMADDSSTKTIRFAYSYNGEPQIAQESVPIDWFDLDDYGLSGFNRYETDSFESGGGYIGTEVIQQPTVLHALIRMHEKCFNGGNPMTLSSVPTLSEVFQCSGSATSLFITELFDHETYNLMYYVNHAYPLMAAGWGSTADYILLEDDMTVDFAIFDNWNFWQTGSFLHFDQDDFYIDPNGSQTFTVYGTPTSAVGDGSTAPTETKAGMLVALYEVTGDTFDNYTQVWEAGDPSGENGRITIDFSETGIDFQSGDEYVLVAKDPNANSELAENAPAFSTIHFTKSLGTLTNVSLNVPANSVLHAQETYQLNPVVTEANANVSYTYTSSNEAAATVSPIGLVTAKTVSAPTDVTITCTATQGSVTKTATATFRVLVGTQAGSVTLDHHYMEIPYNASDATHLNGVLTATLTPADASNTTINWTPYLEGSSNVCLVGYQTGSNQIGVVKPIGVGVETVRGTSQMNEDVYDECLVAVGGKFGDANGDGVVDESDLTAVFNLASVNATSAENFAFIDLDCDGEISLDDYNTVLAIYSGSIVPYVVTE